MRVLLAPDKFKGTLTAAQVADHLRRGLASAAPQLEARVLPVADGGDGTVDALVAAGFARRSVAGGASIAFDGTTAVVEVANTCGLALLDELAPMEASSAPFGEAVAAALPLRPDRLVLALGGSSSTDGGMGLLTALGARFSDASGRPLRGSGNDLALVADVDVSGLVDLGSIEVVVATDVDNVLLGSVGAAAVYGPQKGATPAQVAQLDDGLGRLVGVLDAAWPSVAVRAAADAPGAGAAGGLGFACALLGGRARPGADLVLDLAGFDTHVADCDVVVTGEGRIDEQTLCGKLPIVLARRSGERPVHAVVGRNDLLSLPVEFAGIIAIADTHGPACATDAELSATALRAAGHRLGLELAAQPAAPLAS